MPDAPACKQCGGPITGAGETYCGRPCYNKARLRPCPYSADRLHEMYWYEGQSSSQIAAAASVLMGWEPVATSKVALRWLREAGIAIVTPAEHLARMSQKHSERNVEKAREVLAEMRSGGFVTSDASHMHTRSVKAKVKRRNKKRTVWETRTCDYPGCTITITRKPHQFGRHAYCSRSHAAANAVAMRGQSLFRNARSPVRRKEWPTFICEHCGKPFARVPWQAAASRNRYCSTPCSRAAGNGRRLADSGRKSVMIDATCSWCGTVFPTYPSKHPGNFFCSSACSGHSSNVGRTLPMVTVTCAYCGKSKQRKPYKISPGQTVFFCDRTCYRAHVATDYASRSNGSAQPVEAHASRSELPTSALETPVPAEPVKRRKRRSRPPKVEHRFCAFPGCQNLIIRPPSRLHAPPERTFCGPNHRASILLAAARARIKPRAPSDIATISPTMTIEQMMERYGTTRRTLFRWLNAADAHVQANPRYSRIFEHRFCAIPGCQNVIIRPEVAFLRAPASRTYCTREHFQQRELARMQPESRSDDSSDHPEPMGRDAAATRQTNAKSKTRPSAEELINLRAAGKTLREIGETCGVTRITVRAWLLESGVPPTDQTSRSPGRDVILRLRKVMTPDQIAEAFDVTAHTVFSWMRSAPKTRREGRQKCHTCGTPVKREPSRMPGQHVYCSNKCRVIGRRRTCPVTSDQLGHMYNVDLKSPQTIAREISEANNITPPITAKVVQRWLREFDIETASKSERRERFTGDTLHQASR